MYDLPFEKILDLSKLKVFADDECESKIEIVLGRVDNIMGKEGNAGYQYFFFPSAF